MTRLGGIVLRMLVPALLLPVLGAAAAQVGDALHPGYGPGGGIWPLAAVAYLFVLLGSMTLNAWLLLRHPGSFSDGALPTRVAAVQALQWVLIVVWALVFLGGEPHTLTLAVPGAIAVLSIVVFVLSLTRPKEWGARVEAIELTRTARILAVGYVGLSASAVVTAGVLAALGVDAGLADGALGGPSWALLLLGLPWSHPLYLLLYFALLAGQLSSTWLPYLVPAALAVAVVANIALVSLVLGSPRRRAALTNWFFRLREMP